MRTLVHFASWWSSLTAAIFTRKSCTIRKCRRSSMSVRYGTAWCRWQEGWKPCMTGTSCTEIWSLQMSSCRLTALLNLGTWMFRKLRKMMDYCSPRLVLPTMRAQRCGRISPTITKVTSGRLDACSTKWRHWTRPFARRTWTNCSRLCCLEPIRKFQITIQNIWPILLSFCFKWTQISDQTVTRSWDCL